MVEAYKAKDGKWRITWKRGHDEDTKEGLSCLRLGIAMIEEQITKEANDEATT